MGDRSSVDAGRPDRGLRRGRPLAREHGLTYPSGHERVIMARLERLS